MQRGSQGKNEFRDLHKNGCMIIIDRLKRRTKIIITRQKKRGGTRLLTTSTLIFLNFLHLDTPIVANGVVRVK